MLASSRFFGKVLPTKKTGVSPAESTQKPGFVDAGGDQDNMLYALATGLVDNLLTRPRTNLPVLTQLLAMNKQLQPLSQRLDRIADKPAVLAGFIRTVADTLRQVAVKELKEYPELYQAEFDAVDMLQPGSKMPACSLDALANVLNIPVIIDETEAGKGLYRRQRCMPNRVLTTPYDKIVMRLQDNYYFPLVVHVKQMEAATAAQTALPPVLATAQQQSDPLRQDRRQLIQKAYERFVEDFERHAHRFLTMVEAGEVTGQTLLQVYTSNLTFPSVSHGLVKRADIQHGSQHFFEKAMRSINRPVQVPGLVTMSHEQQLERELSYALAREITLERMDGNVIYAQIEQAEHGQKPARVM